MDGLGCSYNNRHHVNSPIRLYNIQPQYVTDVSFTVEMRLPDLDAGPVVLYGP